jgi:2-isopropylmalate synthase
LKKEGRIVTGNSRDTDTLVASARAYIAAVNKLLNLEARKTVIEKKK